MEPARPNTPHRPVLPREMLASLAPRDGGLYVDGTFGAGGYSRLLLAAAACRVVGIDRDPRAIALGQALVAEGADFTLIPGCFGDVAALLAERGVDRVDGLVLDLGVSSMQLDEAERGFSFQQDGPLDMRMSQAGAPAADLVNRLPEAELADVLYQYGEERASRRIARAIVARRSERPFTTTRDLAGLIQRVLAGKPGDVHPATRSFQALRIAVNDELGELRRALDAALDLLRHAGRLVVVSFHSLEDRLVKRFMQSHAKPPANPSRHAPLPDVSAPAQLSAAPPPLRLLSSKPVTAQDDELRANPRARSAKLRAAERVRLEAAA